MVNMKMAEDLKKLGIKEDDTILMHSSLSSLGYVEGGADTVIDTLLSVLSEGTLLVPTLSYEMVTDENPIFSIKDTPSCVGKISETFRKREKVIRSMHPTHSVCGCGRYAAEILSKHADTSTPVGANSPFALLPKYDGKILMLGCGLKPNTSMHGVEELIRPDYLLREKTVFYTLIDETGYKYQKEYERHNFKNTSQCYDRIVNFMEIPHGKVLEAESWLIDAKVMWEKAYDELKKDCHAFVNITFP